MSSSSAPKKRGLCRGPNHIPKAPVNLDERILIQMQPHLDSTDFTDSKIVKCISQLCLQNWPTPVITWASTPLAHKDAVWVEFQETYNTLMDERYPKGTSRPPIDQELWERASVVKKNYVKGQGQRRRPTISGIGNSGSQSMQSSCQPMPHTAADCVRVICRDCDLLRTLRVHLQSLDPDELADAVATAAQQENDDEARLDDNA
ncbi:hypothetical protein MRB53_022547 [Persea americana]|uniref:Uncharacterized protein n=1 Tax=Persea americana TaxID=3435 RepID=A0ACC2L726_PERAE|nr:hypothetical protein MRB53_022547 [Persea americana]